MSESPDWLERFSRHFPLASIGIENQRLLSQKKVLIAGMGGLGCVSSELLASIGVGYLRIVDYDVIELEILALVSDVTLNTVIHRLNTNYGESQD